MKIVTWNAQGLATKWVDLHKELKDGDFDMLLLQEMTEPPAGAKHLGTIDGMELYEYTVGSSRRGQTTWYIVYRRWTQTPDGNPRCSLGTFVKGYRPQGICTFEGVRRPVIAVQPMEGYPLVCNLHSTSGYNGWEDAASLLETVKAHAESWGMSWVMAGDFNTDPDDLEFLPGQVDQPWTVCRPLEPTHESGRYLDYAIRSMDLGGSNTCERLHPSTSGWHSDHYPQWFDILMPPLGMMG